MADLDREIAGLRCRDLLERLTDYVDGEIEDVEMEQIAAHLRGCAECDKFGGEFSALVHALQTRTATPRVTPRVRARLEERMDRLWTDERRAEERG